MSGGARSEGRRWRGARGGEGDAAHQTAPLCPWRPYVYAGLTSGRSAGRHMVEWCGRRGVSPLQGYGAEYLDLATLARLKVVPPHEIGRQWVCTEEGLVFESHVPLVVKPARRNPKKSKKQTEFRKSISSLRSSETTPRALTEARPSHTNHRELSARAYRREILQPKALQQTVSADRAADRATDRQQLRQC